MGYELHITRGKKQISMDEWQNYIKTDREFTATDVVEATNPNTGAVIQLGSPGMGLWTNPKTKAKCYFSWRRGRISVNGPDKSVWFCAEKAQQAACPRLGVAAQLKRCGLSKMPGISASGMMIDESRSQRIHSGILLGAGIIWQIYAVVLAFRNGPAMRDLMEGLGVELPPLTHAFVATYKFWPSLPIISVLITAAILRRKAVSNLYLFLALTYTVGAALVLHAWLNEAWFLPLLNLLKQIR